MQIERRHRRFYALLGVPKDAQAALGMPGKPRVRFCASLKTEDLPTARIRAATLEAQWLTAIERARGSGKYIEDEASFYATALKNAPTPEAQAQLKEEIWSVAERIEAAAGGLPFGDPDREKTDAYATAARFYGRAIDDLVPFTEHQAAYLAGLKITAKSIAMACTTITAFAPGFPMVADVTRKAVQQWTTTQAKTPQTIRRQLSELRGYWRHLQSIDAAPEAINPFTGIILPRKDKDAPGRLPFTVIDVRRLLAEAKARKDMVLHDMISLAMYTGACIEELASLKVEDVSLKAGWFKIVAAKTKAGRRTVPIHSKLRPILKRLIEASKDGYVLLGTVDQYGDRAGAVAQRFSMLKTAMGFDQRFNFHGLRRTVLTLLENANVLENVCADIVGHQKPRLTFGLYSGGANLKRLKSAIEKLRY